MLADGCQRHALACTVASVDNYHIEISSGFVYAGHGPWMNFNIVIIDNGLAIDDEIIGT